MALKVEDLTKIEFEFPEIYEELFLNSFNRFKLSIKIKKQVIEQIENSLDYEVLSSSEEESKKNSFLSSFIGKRKSHPAH